MTRAMQKGSAVRPPEQTPAALLVVQRVRFAFWAGFACGAAILGGLLAGVLALDWWRP